MDNSYASQWYKAKSNMNEQVFAYLKMLQAKQGYRSADNLKYMRLYGNSEFNGFSAYNYARVESSYNVQNRVTLNIVQSMCDTVVSKIGKNKPKPYFLTDGGDWTLQRRAEKLTQFIEGQFYATKFYNEAQQAFRDATVFGTGAVKIYREGNEIKAERVLIDEITVDDTEAYYGRPLQFHQSKWIHKDVLKGMFPKKSTSIDLMTNDTSYTAQNGNVQNGDMILVVESWKLATKKGRADGVHSICIASDTLFENKKYDKDYPPFVFFRWNTEPVGFFGRGIAKELAGLQIEINKLLKTIQVSMHLVSVPKMLVEASAKIVTSHLDNKIGGIIKYAGTKPEWTAGGRIPPELFSHMETLYQKAFETVGISQLSAQSTKPSGLNSGKALRTYNDLETERFMSVAQRYEQTFLDAADIMIDHAKDISEETDNYSIKCPGSNFLKTIKWSDVEMDSDQYMMQCYPISALSQNPAERQQEVQELIQSGFVSKEDGMKLLDFPDLKSFYSMANAGVEDIEKQIELMVEGEYQTPEPYQNLKYGLQKMQQAYLKYRQLNAPEEVLELFRRWMSDADTLMSNAAQEEQMKAADAQAAAAPLGAPAAPPVSDMVPLQTATAPIA